MYKNKIKFRFILQYNHSAGKKKQCTHRQCNKAIIEKHSEEKNDPLITLFLIVSSV